MDPKPIVVDTKLEVRVNVLTYPIVAKPNVVELSDGAIDERKPIFPKPTIVDVKLLVRVAVEI